MTTPFVVHDWGELIATISTHLVFAVSIFELLLISRMTLRTARTCLTILCCGIALIYGVVSMIDTTIYHLPPEWPAWEYYRRIIWRPWTLLVHGTALWYAWRHRRAWHREAWYVIKQEDAPAA